MRSDRSVSTRPAHLAWLIFALALGPLAATSYASDYDYGGEAVHLYVATDQRGPETLRLKRMLSREHRIDTGDYILLAVIVDNLNSEISSQNFARLSVGGHRGPNIELADFQTRLLAPADDRRDWNLALGSRAHITGFTAILAPRAYSTYRGNDYGYYDRGYLNDGLIYGWIWRDRYYRHPRGHRYYRQGPNYRHSGRYQDRHWRDRGYRGHGGRHAQNHRRYNDRRGGVAQNPEPRRSRPGFGDRDVYAHERRERQDIRRDRRAQENRTRENRNQENRARENRPRENQRREARRTERRGDVQRQRGNHEHRGNGRQRLEQNREQQRPRRQERQQQRAQTRPQPRNQPQPRTRTQPRSQSARSAQQRRATTNRPRATAHPRAQRRPQISTKAMPRRNSTLREATR